MTIFQTLYNQADFPYEQEKNVAPSMTVPDMAMSLSEIMRRSSRGLDVFGNKNPKYDDDDEAYDIDFITPDFNKLDLAERQQLAAEAKEEVERLRMVLNKKAADQREADKKAADVKALEEFKRMQELLGKEEPKKFFLPKEKEESTNTP